MIVSNSGYIMFGKQAVLGTAVTPSISVPYIGESFQTQMENQKLRLGQDNDYTVDGIKTQHREVFSFEVFARPDITAYLLAYVMGADTRTGAGDPYTHALTRNERAYLTIERKLDTGIVQRLYDAKIENITIDAQVKMPVKIRIDGNACKSVMITSARTQTYETRRPFMFYDNASRFKFNTTADDFVKSFQVKINIDSAGGLTDDQFGLVDLPDHYYNVDVQCGFYSSNGNRWKRINYNTSTIPQGTELIGAFECDMRYTENVADDRQFKITIPRVRWRPVGNVNLTSQAQTINESIAGIAEKLSTTEMMTVTIKNSLAADLI